MAVNLTDSEIAAFISEAKPLPENYLQIIQTRAKRGHRERELGVAGANGNNFRLILRQSSFNPLDFFFRRMENFQTEKGRSGSREHNISNCYR